MKSNNNETLFTFVRLAGIAISGLLMTACGGGDSNDPDPTVDEKPIAYVERPTPVDMNNQVVQNDLRDPVVFRPGARLLVKRISTLSSPEIDITSAIIGNTGDVRDPEFNHDGTKLVFSLHMEDDNVAPAETWDIYEYDFTKPLSQATGSENPRRILDPTEAVKGHDIAPHYLPGDRIVFSSNRAQTTGSVLIAEGKFAYSPTIEAADSDVLALNLHTVNLIGTPVIKQITFNMSHDLDPTVIRNIPGYAGHIMFTRWENSPGRNQMSIYMIKPDGSEVKHLYGAHSHATGTAGAPVEFSQPRETSSGNVVTIARSGTGTFDGGDTFVIDVNTYIDNTVPVNAFSGLTGPAQRSVSGGAVDTRSGQNSIAGRYSSVVPLLDGTNRALASYSFCFADVIDPNTMTVLQTYLCNDPRVNLNDPNTVPAPPRYGIYILNLDANTILPVTIPRPNTYLTDVALALDLPPYTFIDDSFPASATPTGTIHIRSVYDLDGAFNPLGSTATSIAQLADPAQATGDPANHPGLIERPAMFLRIVKGVSLPDDNTKDFDTAAFGLGGSGQLMREVIGYVPVDPDGSVKFTAPANVPLSFSILDRNGRRVSGTSRHNNWITLRPNETITCNGCHNHASGAAHGRSEALGTPLNSGADASLTWPNALNTYLVTVGDTMAEARTNTQGASSMVPSVDINYTDNWTDAVAAGRAADVAFNYSYTTLTTASPLNFGACQNNWDENCRIIINYESHIHSIWTVARTDSMGRSTQCIRCHTTYDTANAVVQVPKGQRQLDLTMNSPDAMGNSIDTQNPDYYKSYIELVGQDNVLELMGATLVDANPVVTINPPMSRGNANGSNAFFNIFNPVVTGCDPDNPDDNNCPHWDSNTNVPWLTPGELKLISEWIDIGAQYYNNPIVAPNN